MCSLTDACAVPFLTRLESRGASLVIPVAHSARRTARGAPYMPPSPHLDSDHYTNVDTDMDEDAFATAPVCSQPAPEKEQESFERPPHRCGRRGESRLLVGEEARALEWTRAWSVMGDCTVLYLSGATDTNPPHFLLHHRPLTCPLGKPLIFIPFNRNRTCTGITAVSWMSRLLASDPWHVIHASQHGRSTTFNSQTCVDGVNSCCIGSKKDNARPRNRRWFSTFSRESNLRAVPNEYHLEQSRGTTE